MSESSQTPEDHLATRAILLAVANIASKVNIIFLFVLLSYLLTVEEYGSFRQVWLLNKGLMDVFVFGLPLSVACFLPRLGEDGKKIFVVQSLILLSIVAILLSSALFVFSKEFAALFNNPRLGYFLRLFCLYPLFTLPTLAVEGVLVSIGRTTQFALFTIITKGFLFLVTIVSVLVSRSLEGLFMVLIIYALFELLASLGLIFYYMKDFGFNIGKLEVGKQLKFAFPLGLANVVDIMKKEVDKVMVASSFSISEFGLYANGAFEVPFIGTIVSSISSALTPDYMRLSKKGDYLSILRLWHESTCRVAIFFLPLIVFLFIFSSDFITILFSNKYEKSAIIFQIYLFAILPKVTWYGTILVFIGHNKEPFYGSSIALISNVFLNMLFIQWIGLTGPALATALTTYILVFYFLYRIRDVLGVSWRQVFPWSRLLKMFLVSIGLSIVLTPFLFFHVFPKILVLGLASIVYAIPVYYAFRRLSLISDKDVEFINRFVLKIRYKLSPST